MKAMPLFLKVALQEHTYMFNTLLKISQHQIIKVDARKSGKERCFVRDRFIFNGQQIFNTS